MAKSADQLADELLALKASLADRPDMPAAPDEAEGSLLDELKQALADAGDKAEEFVAEHPMASVGAAFLLGYLIGHKMGGSGK